MVGVGVDEGFARVEAVEAAGDGGLGCESLAFDFFFWPELVGCFDLVWVGVGLGWFGEKRGGEGWDTWRRRRRGRRCRLRLGGFGRWIGRWGSV